MTKSTVIAKVASPESRALSSGGTNSGNMIQFAVSGLDADISRARAILDLGCGRGELGEFLRKTYKARLDGMDIVSYEHFCASAYDHLILTDLNSPIHPNSDTLYDMVFGIEVIEHLENPRAFVRFAANLLRSGGKLIVTTPNVTSLASVLTLAFQGHFRDFRDGEGMYPAHLSPVLPLDARRIVQECGLKLIDLDYSNSGRIPFMLSAYQQTFPFLKGKWFSDNVRVVAVKS